MEGDGGGGRHGQGSKIRSPPIWDHPCPRCVCDTALLLQMPPRVVECLQMFHTCDEVIWALTYHAVQQEFRPPVPSLHTAIHNPTTPLPANMLRCGENTLCCKCSEVVHLLGKCWHYRKAVAVLSHLLSHPAITHASSYPALHTRPHDCKSSCPKILYPQKKRKSFSGPPRSDAPVKKQR